jgi:excisionase family DNA binding protein
LNKRKNTTEHTIQPWLVTIPEAAAILGIGKSKVYDLIANEGLPKVKFGTAVRIPVKALQEWLSQREREDIA